MPLNALTGTRIRERRAQSGLRQADLARAAGVSASYLNLIEHNRRKAAGPVLARIAAALGVTAAALEGDGEADLSAALREAAAAAAEPVEIERAEELAGRFPGWARLVAAQHRRATRLERTVAALADRMTQDPHLSATLHELLSATAAVRSTAAILADTPDIEPEWRERFHRNLSVDTARLASGAEALVAYLDGVAAPDAGFGSPQEEFEGWLAARDWTLAGLDAGDPAETILADAAELASQAARALARDWLRLWVEDARMLPSGVLRAALSAVGHDPLRLAGACTVPPATVFRRLALLPETSSGLGLVICDGSGTLMLRRPVAGFPVPRFGAACPLWPLYEALMRPGQPVQTRLQVSGRGGGQFDAWALAVPEHPDGSAGPVVWRSYMLLVAAGGEAPGARLVGSSCRICPRLRCAARREPSITGDGV